LTFGGLSFFTFSFTFQKKELVMSFDGNFGLVRKKTSGKSFEPPLDQTLFVEDDIVSQYLKSADDTDGDKYKGVSHL
jgi:hypothetical protein